MSVIIYVKGDPFLVECTRKEYLSCQKMVYKRYGGPQGSLHKKCQLHIKLCTLKIQIKNVAANKKKMFLQIKNDVAANKKDVAANKKICCCK